MVELEFDVQMFGLAGSAVRPPYRPTRTGHWPGLGASRATHVSPNYRIPKMSKVLNYYHADRGTPTLLGQN
jgi:hypothetical protein